MPQRFRALIVGRNGHNALLRSMSTFPWLPPSGPDYDDEEEWQATTCDNASDAADTWLDAYNQGVPFSLVFSPLAPNTLLDGTIIDPARREICLASGIGLFHFIRTHGGTTTPLIAVVRGSSSWGAETLYAAAAHDWFGAGILDTVLRNSSTGQPLYIPAAIDSPLTNGEETLARQLRIRANIIWETLHSIETQRHRGNLSQPLGHALQWLRIIIKLDYKPQLLETVAAHINSNLLTVADGMTMPMYVHLPTTRKTITKYLVETFDSMRTIAIEYVGYDRVWAEFGLTPPKQFWDSPCTRSARHFIDLAYNFLVFEDIDIPWLEFSQRMPPPPLVSEQEISEPEETSNIALVSG